jgi:hypothetical protein
MRRRRQRGIRLETQSDPRQQQRVFGLGSRPLLLARVRLRFESDPSLPPASHASTSSTGSALLVSVHEEETGIKRWTDGLSWSPSRTLDNFLVYRELDKKLRFESDPSLPPASHASTSSTGSALLVSGPMSRLRLGLVCSRRKLDVELPLQP